MRLIGRRVGFDAEPRIQGPDGGVGHLAFAAADRLQAPWVNGLGEELDAADIEAAGGILVALRDRLDSEAAEDEQTLSSIRCFEQRSEIGDRRRARIGRCRMVGEGGLRHRRENIGRNVHVA